MSSTTNSSSAPENMGPIPTGRDYQGLYLRSDFGVDDLQGLDAPAYVPRGSHRVNRIHETATRWFFTSGFCSSTREFCPPPAVNVAVAGLPVPAVAGPVVGTSLSDSPVLALKDSFSLDVGVRTVMATTPKLSNLDCRDKLVKRGVKVSYQGFRGIVVRVNRGRCVVGYLDAFERFTGWTEWVICERLQVVA